MKQIFKIIEVLLFIVLSSCEYEPNGIFERNLNQNATAPQIQTVELDLSQNEDTVDLVFGRVYFNFKSTNQAIRWVKFYINDSCVGTVNSGNSYYDFDYYFSYNGYYKLNLEIFTKSGTGSIADSLGAEGFLFKTKQWMIKVHSTIFFNLTSTVSDGFLKLRWIKPSNDIPEYIIYNSNYEIGRTSSSEFIDKGYVGQGGWYRVFYVDKMRGGQLTTCGEAVIPNEMNLTFTCDTDNNYSVQWGKLKYYAAVDSIILLGNDGFYLPYDVEKTTDISKTSFEISGKFFGLYKQYHLVLIPKYPNPLYSPSKSPYSIFGSPRYDFMIGYPSPIYNDFSRLSNSEFIYHTYMYDHGNTAHNDSVFRYSVIENKIMERYRFYSSISFYSGAQYGIPTTSPDGNYFISIFGSSKTTLVCSPYNFNNYKKIDISNLTDYVMKIPISNSGTGIVNSGNKKYLYDFKNSSLLGYVDDPTYLYDYNISSDGKYFFFSVGHTIYLYTYSNNTITLANTLYSYPAGSFDYFNFMANEPSEAVSWSSDTKTFNVLSCPDMSILKSFSVNEDRILYIDYYTNRILSFSPNLLVVRSLNDGSVLYSIPVGFSNIASNNCFLTGNAIFHQQGARYFLH
jgi:hypothetical protein